MIAHSSCSQVATSHNGKKPEKNSKNVNYRIPCSLKKKMNKLTAPCSLNSEIVLLLSDSKGSWEALCLPFSSFLTIGVQQLGSFFCYQFELLPITLKYARAVTHAFVNLFIMVSVLSHWYTGRS